MIDDVYQTDLLKLAARARGAGRLPSPQRTARVDNPLCGDRITIDVEIEGERVSAIGYEVKACVLCQASASALAEGAVGRRGDELEALGRSIEDMLKGGAPPPGEPWAAFDAFLPVRKAKSRHECVMLPFRALEEALAPREGEGS